MGIKKYFVLLIGFFMISIVSASIQIEPNNFIFRKAVFTGEEDYLWEEAKISMFKFCIKPKEPELKDIVRQDCFCREYEKSDGIGDLSKCKLEECVEKIYKYPTTAYLYKGKTPVLDESKDIATELNKDGELCFGLNPLIRYYRLFDNPIIIDPTTIYNSTDTNVTQENAFAHLNLSIDKVNYFSFDVNASASTTYDYSNASNDGILEGVVWNENGGVYGGAYDFDGVNDYIQLNSDNDELAGNDWAISMWLNFLDQTSSSGGIAATKTTGNGFGIERRSGGTSMRFYVFDCSSDWVLANVFYNTAGWHHYVFMMNSSGRYVFRDNSLLGKGDSCAGLTQPNPLLLGYSRVSDNAHSYLNGTMDEVMISNRSFSYTEISYIYNSSFSRFYPLGEMLFEDLNFSTNNTVNVSIPNCQQFNGSTIKFRINGGNWTALNSSCAYDSYNITGDAEDANLTLQLNSSTLNFYSPIVHENISLNSWYIEYDIVELTNIINHTIPYNQQFSYTFTTKGSPAYFWLNDTSIFNVENNGTITNTTTLSETTYSLNVSVNDSKDYLDYEVFWINVTDEVGGGCRYWRLKNIFTGRTIFGIGFCDGHLTFKNGETLDNDIDGTIRVTGNLNVTGNYTRGGDIGYTGYCSNTTYSGGIAATCND